MAETEKNKTGTMVITNRQRLFVRYLLAVLIDLTVLNLFVEYWDKVVIDSFTISLFAAVVLQIFLKAAILIEQRLAYFLKTKPGKIAIALRLFGAWTISFGSKFVILGVIGLIFGDHVDFGGLIPFIVVVFTILAAEVIITRIVYHSLMTAE
jgi:hypothetical protein